MGNVLVALLAIFMMLLALGMRMMPGLLATGAIDSLFPPDRDAPSGR